MLRDRRTLLTLILVFVAALAVRLGYLADSSDHPAFRTPIVDASFYDLAARQLAAGGESVPRLFWQPYLYPRIVAAVYALGGSLLTVKILQAFLGALTAAATFLFARRRLGPRAAIAAGAIVALYGPLILFEGELLAAGWAAFETIALLLLLDWAGERIGRAPRKGAGAAAAAIAGAAVGAVGAMAILTRPTFAPLLIAAGLWLVLCALRGAGPGGVRRALALVAAGAGVFVLLVAPVASASRRALGSFSFLPASGALNLYIGNSPDLCATLTVRPGAEWGELLGLPGKGGAGSEPDRARYFRDRVLDLARHRPGVFVANLGAKALRFLSSRELPRNLDVYLWRRWSAVLSVLIWKLGPFGFPFGLVLPFALVGAVWGWRRSGTPLLLFLALYPLAVIAVFVSARYRVPAVPALAVAAAVGGSVLVEAIRAREGRKLAWMVFVGVAAVLLATLPGPFCEEAIPVEADFWRNLGSAQELRGEKAEAEESYRSSLAASSRETGAARRDAWEVRLNLGRLLAERGRTDEALAQYRQAVSLAPERGEPRYNLGLLLLARGRAEEAAKVLEEAAKLDPGLPRIDLHRARALAAAGRPEDGLTVALEAVRKAPNDAEARFVLGGLLLNRGHAEEAVAQLRRALELRASPKIHNELGTALIALGRTDEAIGEYEAALAGRPDDVEALSNLGAALAMSGRFAAARERFGRAVELRPEDPVAHFNLALALERLGEPQAAIRELQRVLEIDPGHRLARQRLERLRRESPSK